eukprot:3750862-Pyramimonas_sp.AAC.1
MAPMVCTLTALPITPPIWRSDKSSSALWNVPLGETLKPHHLMQRHPPPAAGDPRTPVLAT